MERSKCKGIRFSEICLFVQNKLAKCGIYITGHYDVKYSNNVIWCMIHSSLVCVLYLPDDKYADCDICDIIQK